MRKIAAIAAALTLTAGTAAGTTGFSPKSVRGTYKGPWNNTTFSVTGTVTVRFTAEAHNGLGISAEVGGSGFGCAAVPKLPKMQLPKGSGANHWDSTGFRLKKSGSFGSVNITLKAGRLTGSGKAPPSCAPGVTYRINGSMRAGRIRGTATIDLGTRTAMTTFEAIRG